MKDPRLQTNLKHGLSGTPEYTAWRSMLDRCEDPTCWQYPNYGGRGIKVCERWRSDVRLFLFDVGSRPSPEHSLDRIDVNGHYEPGNCRWATRAEQARSRRGNHRITYNGRTLCLVDWAREAGLYPSTFLRRLQAGWSIERALSEPSREHAGA